MQTATELKPADKIKAVCAELGLTMTAEFVPFSKSRNAEPREDGKVWRSLNWKVTIQRNLRVQTRDAIDAPRPILTTDYAAGEAYCPAYKASVEKLGARNSVIRNECIAWECEHGKPASWFNSRAGLAFGASGKPILPDLEDVVYSLVSDANVLDCGTFEEWAAELGYDPDSRKAEATYRACLEIALKLRNGIGEAGLAKLRDACQDY